MITLDREALLPLLGLDPDHLTTDQKRALQYLRNNCATEEEHSTYNYIPVWRPTKGPLRVALGSLDQIKKVCIHPEGPYHLAMDCNKPLAPGTDCTNVEFTSCSDKGAFING